MRRIVRSSRWHLVAVLALALMFIIPAVPASAQYYGYPGYGYGGYGYGSYGGYGYGGYGYGGYGYPGYGYSSLYGYGSFGIGYNAPTYGTGYAYGTYGGYPVNSLYAPYSGYSYISGRPYGYNDPYYGPIVYGQGMINDPCCPGGINFYGIQVTSPDMTTTTTP